MRRVDITASGSASRQARAMATSFSKAWNFAHGRAASFVQVVSSLVSSATQNRTTGGTIGVELEVRDASVHGSVRDGSEWTGDEEHGLSGIQIADALADELEVHHHTDGNSVSFELREPWSDDR